MTLNIKTKQFKNKQMMKSILKHTDIAIKNINKKYNSKKIDNIKGSKFQKIHSIYGIEKKILILFFF